MARWGEMVEEDDDDEYAKLVRRMNPPRVVIDNDACDNATVIRVDRVKKHGILLEAVQVLVDLNLVITKAYISSDGNWFMDVFNVTDQDGSKLQNMEVIDHIQKCLESDGYLAPPANGPMGGFAPPAEDQFTSIELTGADRPGLLSEVCAVLAALSCNIVKAEVWTHDRRAAAVIQITDESTGLAIHDAGRLSRAQELLCNLMQGDGTCNRGGTGVSVGAARAERRLHKLMLEDHGGGGGEKAVGGGEERGGCGKARPKAAKVVVMDCTERQYTVVILRCRDRPKLLFDTLCALNDLQYVVFHGMVDAEGASKEAYQEYYIRHVDGHPVRSDAERTRLVRCLEAAVERRASNGLELELEVRTEDRMGLLSEITRVFRENSLSIIRAAITTKDGKAEDTFYVSDTYGNPVDGRTIDAVGEQLGHAVLRVKRSRNDASVKAEAEAGAVSVLGSLLKGSFQGLRLIRSYS
ncbi:ACT domain-containing protein ACR6-like [Miscanthus floridulus]|uniref:ACT domain-containing protein ACR6-like n=1 Tax=Miscanthus floridulus TaxID=154761 RepID=UPI00345851E1